MAVYLVFSDEAGDYKKVRNDKFIRNHPFYCRSAVILNASHWKCLRDNFCNLKEHFLNIEPTKEVKWSYIWSVASYKRSNKKIPKSKAFYFLKDYSIDTLVSFVDKSLELLSQCDDCCLVYTITFNEKDKTPKISEEKILKMHLQDIMQRIQMQIQMEADNLAVFFFDSKSKKIDYKLKEIYQSVYQEGDFIERYTHIIDSIVFDWSHHSIGIQFADYCAGVFYGLLKSHKKSFELFRNRIWQKVRNQDGDCFGYGICEVPSNAENRNYLRSKINTILDSSQDVNIEPS